MRRSLRGSEGGVDGENAPLDYWDPVISRPKTRGETRLPSSFGVDEPNTSILSKNQLKTIAKHKKKLSSAMR